MLLEKLGSLFKASSCGQYISEAINADDTQKAIQPARELIWDSSLGRKIVRPLSSVAWDTISGNIDGRVAGYAAGGVLTTTLIGSAFFYGDPNGVMVVTAMGTGLYGTIVMGELGGLLGGSIGCARSIYAAMHKKDQELVFEGAS